MATGSTQKASLCALASTTTPVVIGLVGFIDSTGLGANIMACRRVEELQHQYSLAGLQLAIAKVFKVSDSTSTSPSATLTEACASGPATSRYV